MQNVCDDIPRRTREGQNLYELPAASGPVRLVIAKGWPRSGVPVDVPARKTFLVAWLALRPPQNSHRSGHEFTAGLPHADYVRVQRAESASPYPTYVEGKR